ncbi:hypothetical protein J3E68DRAFT_346724 [Trichoderma sp. SZMC 28012]
MMMSRPRRSRSSAPTQGEFSAAMLCTSVGHDATDVQWKCAHQRAVQNRNKSCAPVAIQLLVPLPPQSRGPIEDPGFSSLRALAPRKISIAVDMARTRPMRRPWSVTSHRSFGPWLACKDKVAHRASQAGVDRHSSMLRSKRSIGRNGVGGRRVRAADSCPYQARTWDIQLALHSPHFRSCVSESKALPCHLCLNVAL